MTVAVLASASSIPSSLGTCSKREWGGEAEPSTEPVVVSMSRELGLAFSKAHRAWALRYAPWLLEEWLND